MINDVPVHLKAVISLARLRLYECPLGPEFQAILQPRVVVLVRRCWSLTSGVNLSAVYRLIYTVQLY